MQPPVTPSIQIPAANEPVSSGAGSPRAALIAGLRSATERRHREQGQSPGTSFHTSPPLSPLPMPGGGHSTHSSRSSFSSLNGFPPLGGSPSQGAISDSGLSADHPYSILYAKQQELLATSMLISQQQQRLQSALNQVAGVTGAALGSPQYPYPDDQLVGSLANLNLDPPPSRAYGLSPSLSPTSHTPNYNGSSRIQSPASQLLPQSPRNSFFNQSAYSIPDINQASNFSSPARPSSSASFRRGYSGYGNSGSPNLGYTNSPAFHASSENTGSPAGFRRGHRKASSLSSMSSTSQHMDFPLPTPSYAFGSYGRTSSNLSQPPGLIAPKKFTAGTTNYEVPIRQPYGPPPLDELKQRGKEINFANMPNLENKDKD